MRKEYNIGNESIDDISLLEPEGLYSYADYIRWSFEERVELIKGKIFNMSPAPKAYHQEVSGNIHFEVKKFLQGKPCKVFAAPFDVRIPKNLQDADSQILTVVQPDICVICDLDKIDEFGCKGAPDLIVEILSPSTAKKDLENKFELYEESGVKEYWIVYPGESIIEPFELKNNTYISKGKFLSDSKITSTILSGLEIELKDIFE